MLNALIALDARHYDNVYGDEITEALGQHVRWTAGPKTAAELVRDPSPLRDVEVLFTGWGGPVLDQRLLDAAPRLRAVFHAAGSIRPIVTPAFWQRALTITQAAAINAEPVAEFCLAAVLLSLKHVWRLSQELRRQRTFPADLNVPGVCGSTVGLVSLGTVGQRVAQQLARFDLQLLAHDPFVDSARAAALGVTLCSLQDIFERSDVVSLHTPLLPSTRGLITGALFAAMKPGATFINTARGAVVREAEMIASLRARPDVMALLDVTDPEPPVGDSDLYSLPNVILTPHIAGSYGRECRRLGRCMLEEFDRYIRGEPLLYALSEQQAAVLA